MASTSQRTSSKRRASNRSSSNASRGRQATASARRKPSSASARPRNQRSSSNGNRSRRSQDSHETIKTIGVSVMSATIGAAGGVLLGRTALQHSRKVLGVPLPNRVDLSGVSHQIGEAGRQFGKLAGEVRAVREKAEQVGRILT